MVASFCFVAMCCARGSMAQKFSVAQLDKVVRVSDPQISPDGNTIVVVVSHPNFADDRYDADLVQVDVATGRTRTLTQNRRGVSSPRWAPSGDRLAFLANVGIAPNARNQIFVLPMSGGDAQQITTSSAGVQQFAWRPDGAMIAFAAADDQPKRSEEEKQNDVFEVGNDDFLVHESPMPTHVWVVAPDGTGARRLTSGKWSLPISHPPGAPSSPLAWSPDGKSIAIVRVETPSSGDSDRSTLRILDVATGAMRAVTKRAKNEGYPVWSPDGTKLVYWFPRDGQNKFGTEVFVAPAAGGEGSDVTRGLDRNIQRTIWMPDGNSLLVGANDATSVGLWLQPVDGGAARRVPLGKICPASSFWVEVAVGRNGEIAFTGSEPQRPGELYYLPSAAGPARRLTNFNDAIASLQLGKTESIDWDGPNQFHLDGVVTYPPDFAPGRKWPLVLYVHGGPRAASKEAFSSRAQLLAAEGWVVFEPNYRGSDNLGSAFQAAIWGDAGDGPGRDVMSGVELLKKRGWVDETRIAVTGWSYGGYMTTWLIGHYNIWRVAIAGAPVTNWLDQYNLGDANVRRGEAFGGSPYVADHMRAFIDQSPITYANKMKAPTLILCDVGDYRVPITQSYSLYHALKDNGVETQFFAYPVGGHSPSDPVRQRDIDRKWIWWLKAHLESSAAPGATN
jgi:dipeptidyl aminopeptidase/acylaminoacyl peptidase